MIINDIHVLVEQAINGDGDELFNYVLPEDNKMGQFQYATAIRLIKLWNKLKVYSIYQIDFECSLRNYLLLMKTDIIILDYEPSTSFSGFGLNLDSNTRRISCTLLFPDFVNDVYVKKIFMEDLESSNRQSNHNLSTNHYIHELTGNKFKNFKSQEQKLVVMGALKTPDGYSCLVSMSTGGGKSLITQTLAYQHVGLTIVIVPTISLMLDQAKNAKQIINSNVDDEIFYYYSGCDLTKFYDSLEKKVARLLFISPESLIKNVKLRECIEKVNNEGYLRNLVVDEAHIIIEWGSSFRIDFQCLDALQKKLLITNPKLRTFLLSATFSDETIRQLKMFYNNDDKWIEIRCDRLRHETRFDVIKCSSYSEKNGRLKELIALLPRPMIVYVKSPDDAEKLKNQLQVIGYHSVQTYTGRTTSSQREKLIDSWKNDEFDLMIATCAFGVGVDKKDVRTVLHTYIPENPNKYYQEAGRGGRDGLPCLSTVLYIQEDVDAAFTFISKVITTEKLLGRWFSMIRSEHTKRLNNGIYLLDTYVKPEYNSNEEFIDYISNHDVTWNVYVILFLRRNGLIFINDIQYINEKYIFYISLINRSILDDNTETEKLVEELRVKEWKHSEYEFILMRNSLQRIGKTCWSSMFNKIYRRTDEYCAGCNEHMEIVDFEELKALKKSVPSPLSKIDDRIKEYSYGSTSLIVINQKNIRDTFTRIIPKGADMVVASDEFISEIVSLNLACDSKVIYCNYFDFFELSTSDKYYASGAVVIYFPEDKTIQKIIINIVESNTIRYDIEYIICAEEDYYLPFKNKNLSEFNGHCKQEY